VTKKITWWNR